MEEESDPAGFFARTVNGAEKEAWRIFARRRLPRGLKRIVGPDDVLQEAYLALRGHEPVVILQPGSWVKSVIRNTISNMCRFHLRTRRLTPPSGIPTRRESEYWSPIVRIFREEETELVLRFAESLDGDEREVFVDHWLRGMKIGIIAERSGIVADEVSRIVYRTKIRFEKFIHEREKEGGQRRPEQGDFLIQAIT